MIPPFEADRRGTGICVLPQGIHDATLDEVAHRFGWNEWRRGLIVGLKAGLAALERAGCKVVYLDGSFVTSKEEPGDFDAAWDPNGVNPLVLDPLLWLPPFVCPPRAEQKSKYRGEFLTTTSMGVLGENIVTFFQGRREGGRKGIVRIWLGGGL